MDKSTREENLHKKWKQKKIATRDLLTTSRKSILRVMDAISAMMDPFFCWYSKSCDEYEYKTKFQVKCSETQKKKRLQETCQNSVLMNCWWWWREMESCVWTEKSLFYRWWENLMWKLRTIHESIQLFLYSKMILRICCLPWWKEKVSLTCEKAPWIGASC